MRAAASCRASERSGPPARGLRGTSGRGSRRVSAAEIPYTRAATYTGPSPPTAFRATKPTGAAPSAPATAIRPRRAFARISPSCFEAYAIVRPFFTIPCTRERTSITSTTGNSRFDRQLRRQVEGQHAAPGGGGERDRATRSRTVQDRHDQRSRQRERQHREPQEQRDPDARFGDRHVEEHRVRERDREQRIARDAREVVQAVRVDRIRRGPHPMERMRHEPLEGADHAEHGQLPRPGSAPAGAGTSPPGGYPWRRSRRMSCASFGSAVPPAFCIS